MKGAISSLVLINQSFCHVLTSEPVLLVIRRSLLINNWHQSPSLKSTNKPYSSCSIACTQLELGKCVHDVHIIAHCWLWCICQIHRPLLMFLSLRTYFINTLTQSDPSFVVCSVLLLVFSLPTFSWPVSRCVSASQSLWDAFLTRISKTQYEPTRLWWWAMCKAAFSSLTWSRDRCTVLWSKEY